MIEKSKMKKIKAIALSMCLLLCACGCGEVSTKEGTTTDVNSSNTRQASQTNTTISTRTYEAKYKDYDTSVGKDAVTMNGSNESIIISDAGTYVLSGNFIDQILIDADSEDLVHLVLNGANITCEDSAAILGLQSDKIIITLAEGTVNTITDGKEYIYESEEEDEPNAAIFSKDDLTINGSGTLIVNANYEDGIRTKDDLVIISGTIKITSVKDAIQGKDSVCILDGNFTINSGNDAIKSSNDSDTEKGYVIIDGGNYTITAVDDAFHAETGMIINSGEIDIITCYEGIEGLLVEINGGNISLYATDDGVNAAGGSDVGESFFGGGRFGGNSDAAIVINGGTLYINAEGDGLDSNGDLTINGGTIYVEGPTNDGNGAIDYDGTGLVNGGTIVAAGSLGMAMSFDSSSAQCFVLYNFTQWREAGTTITLTDGDGNELVSYVPTKKYNSVVISTSEMEENGTYTLISQTEIIEITLEGTSYSNGRGGFGSGKNSMERPTDELLSGERKRAHTSGDSLQNNK